VTAASRAPVLHNHCGAIRFEGEILPERILIVFFINGRLDDRRNIALKEKPACHRPRVRKKDRGDLTVAAFDDGGTAAASLFELCKPYCCINNMVNTIKNP